MRTEPVPILSDNFAYLLVGENGRAAVVDPGEAGPVLRVAREKNLSIEAVLLTHHHTDHVAGAREVARETGARVLGPAADGVAADEDLAPGPRELLGEPVRIFHVPGHTRGHIGILLLDAAGTPREAVVGDILFVAGCGRLFEGTAGAMWEGLAREILPLPDGVVVHPGHDYGRKNLAFAASVVPEATEWGRAIRARKAEADEAARAGRPFLPTTIGEEKRTNPFLLAADPSFRAAVAPSLGVAEGAAEVFAALRRLRDRY